MQQSDDVIHEAVAGWARRTPRAPALVCGGTVLSYAELDRAADDFAAGLAARGVSVGDLVPVVLPRSPGLVVSLLGVLKFGAAYAALDPRWPGERLAVLRGRLSSPVAVTEPVPVEEALRRGRTPSRASCDGRSAACVFFTSGTSGVPKGVVSPHRATTRLFRSPGFAAFGPGRVVSVAAALPWDAFGLELWGALCNGGTAVAAEEDFLLPDGLAAMIRDHGVDTAWLTASQFNLFVDENIGCFRGLRQLLTGGERLSVPHVRRFLDRYPDTALINGYGPVESCVFATTHLITHEDLAHPHGVPLGRPVPGTEVLVVDDRLVPVPPGGDGEICVAGEGLAEGYLGDPALTARRFVDAPSDGPALRLYRTGDLGCVDDTGTLHFLGRRDRQVKIRGHRVEPEEIEVRCEAVDGVERAVVTAAPAGG
ncbi:hypothetical protein N566_04815, partial [Streptomycetaceae bacterium MP113-05]